MATPATEKQIKFLDDLVAKREIPTTLSAEYLSAKATLDVAKASQLISQFLGFPRIEVKTALAEKPAVDAKSALWAELFEALSTIPQSKYAVPVSELMTDFLKKPVHGDLVFLEVKEYMKRIYIKQLFGSVGAFTRVRTDVEDALAFVRIIQRDPYKYARLFGEHYKCCGKCGAELTDPISRELMLGPWCRKAFGR
jgi:hypothetical protein